MRNVHSWGKKLFKMFTNWWSSEMGKILVSNVTNAAVHIKSILMYGRWGDINSKLF